MTVHRVVSETPGTLFFVPGLPVYVNRVNESFKLTEHTHDFIEICCVSEGSGTHYIGGQTLSVSAGDLFYVPVGVSHVFRPASAGRNAGLVVYNCLFTRELLERLPDLFPMEQETLSRFERAERDAAWFACRDNGGQIVPLLQRLHLEFTTKAPGWTLSLYAGFLELLVAVHRERSSAEPSRRDGGLRSWENARQWLGYIHHHFAEPITAAQIAELADLSERQFHRLFKQKTGLTFTAYLQQLRIRQSCRLLLDGQGRVSDIAAAVGYQDMTFFNRLFKKLTGTTPREYRKRADNGKRHHCSSGQ